MQDYKPIVGTELKLLVRVLPIGDVHLQDMNFTCHFYTRSDSCVKVEKSEMLFVSEDSYIALVDTSDLQAGVLRNRIIFDIPDSDFHDGYRREVTDVETGVKLFK